MKAVVCHQFDIANKAKIKEITVRLLLSDALQNPVELRCTTAEVPAQRLWQGRKSVYRRQAADDYLSHAKFIAQELPKCLLFPLPAVDADAARDIIDTKRQQPDIATRRFPFGKMGKRCGSGRAGPGFELPLNPQFTREAADQLTRQGLSLMRRTDTGRGRVAGNQQSKPWTVA